MGSLGHEVPEPNQAKSSLTRPSPVPATQSQETPIRSSQQASPAKPSQAKPKQIQPSKLSMNMDWQTYTENRAPPHQGTESRAQGGTNAASRTRESRFRSIKPSRNLNLVFGPPLAPMSPPNSMLFGRDSCGREWAPNRIHPNIGLGERGGDVFFSGLLRPSSWFPQGWTQSSTAFCKTLLSPNIDVWEGGEGLAKTRFKFFDERFSFQRESFTSHSHPLAQEVIRQFGLWPHVNGLGGPTSPWGKTWPARTHGHPRGLTCSQPHPCKQNCQPVTLDSVGRRLFFAFVLGPVAPFRSSGCSCPAAAGR